MRQLYFSYLFPGRGRVGKTKFVLPQSAICASRNNEPDISPGMLLTTSQVASLEFPFLATNSCFYICNFSHRTVEIPINFFSHADFFSLTYFFLLLSKRRKLLFSLNLIIFSRNLIYNLLSHTIFSLIYNLLSLITLSESPCFFFWDNNTINPVNY